MGEHSSIGPMGTPTSFERQIRSLREELGILGVDATDAEVARIMFLSERKYNRYELFPPGETFQHRLILWLERNFAEEDRETAMTVVKSLKFVNQHEMRALAIATFDQICATLLNKNPDVLHDNWRTYFDSANQDLRKRLQGSIFVAVADDVMFDYFRRAIMQRVPGLPLAENFVPYYKLDAKSIEDLPEHEKIFLVDQLSGSGRSFLRKEEDKWTGKLPRFERIWGADASASTVYYCPYIQSRVASEHLITELPKWSREAGLGSRRSQALNPSSGLDPHVTGTGPLSGTTPRAPSGTGEPRSTAF